MNTRLPQGRAVRRRITGPTTGRVVTVTAGVAQVAMHGVLVTASVGASMLRSMASAPEAAPCAGDRVGLLRWSDGRVTIEKVIARPV